MRVNCENIPGELKNIPHWVLWRKENLGREKPAKVPCAKGSEFSSRVTFPWRVVAKSVRYRTEDVLAFMEARPVNFNDGE